MGEGKGAKMILLTGDTHATVDLKKLFPLEQSKYSKKDYLIILGDVGVCWYGGAKDETLQKYYDQTFPMTVLFIDGNHDNHDLLNRYPVDTWNGGKVHFIKPTLIHLMRGQFYEIEGKTFFTMGGATSVDKFLRTPGVSWWPEELPSMDEYGEAWENLEKHQWKTDYVLTHCCDSKTLHYIDPSFQRDALTDYLHDVEVQLDYKKWYFGHYHIDRDVCRDGRNICLYDRIVKLGEGIESDG